MRKVLASFLALLILCAGASAESLPPKLLPESYFLADIQRNYPDWSVRISTRYGSGRYEGEMAQYAEVSLYRITDEAIELLELTALVNPIREGDDVPWSVHALIPVEIVPGASDHDRKGNLRLRRWGGIHRRGAESACPQPARGG